MTPIDITEFNGTGITYSICTFITKPAQYKHFVDSMLNRGFTSDFAEFIYIDNSKSNKFDAFSGINKFLNIARGEYIMLCHQDLLLLDDGREKLDEIIRQLDEKDPRWGLFGNSGSVSLDRMAVRITDKWGADQSTHIFPVRTTCLDENFIVVRKDANLSLSHDLNGFHLYGTDLCIIADILGLNAYVVDFHLTHLGCGAKGPSFDLGRCQMIDKYCRALSPRVIRTPSAIIVLQRSRVLAKILNTRISTEIILRFALYMNKLRRMFSARRSPTQVGRS
jgi:hypothetical protein